MQRPYFGMIFFSGAIVLALEVIASRIMTPYFGVSLYIWSSILSITLLALALGYYWGGKIANRAKIEDITACYLAFPAVSPFIMLFSRRVYPDFFPSLASMNLVVGSFIACVVFLGPVLVLLSALNPLLIAINNAEENEGDAGSGKVLFLSTVGSVVGVIVTAFILIPNVSNSNGILWIAFFLGLVSFIFSLFPSCVEEKKKKAIIIMAAVGTMLCLFAVLMPAKWKSFLLSGTSDSSWNVVEEYPSFFNTSKVIDVKDDKESIRFIFQDGGTQNAVSLKDGRSLASYTYILNEYPLSVFPGAENVLVLGLGGGVIPAFFKAKDKKVDVVEIDKNMLVMAKKYFDFNESGIDVYIEDARTYMRKTDKKYDIIIVDLFHSLSVPDYLLTTEFFADIKRSMSDKGVMVMNTIQSYEHDEILKLLTATISTSFPNITVMPENKEESRKIINVCIAASLSEMPKEIKIDYQNIPEKIRYRVVESIDNKMTVEKSFFAGVYPATDDMNTSTYVYADAQKDIRGFIISAVPNDILMN